ncbi:MAG: heavy-metal-associated domain-containing protein [Bacteroidia bacterium]|nr:heavy-metal-associated domain-containing protein [Bacteroidia bacterium]NND26436.1 heavy-metal-associated domain-containing protein [Flavobacteriaceae bacterium]MBT8279744.1 heavy-metal-associated domain-containing protein [Bacteroidia bacterium]NNK59238.1 heavy-metal-associated domain-containing protein [Flavobacteriaceae bacterium]NNL32916.1 heavy-metal-associated domain-containing protein [Flavobacteriaceae bacterium]
MTTTFIIQNLKCGGCAKTINSKLKQLEEISEIQVDPDFDAVSFSHENESDIDRVKHVLENLGYPVLGDANSRRKKIRSYMSCAMGRFID